MYVSKYTVSMRKGWESCTMQDMLPSSTLSRPHVQCQDQVWPRPLFHGVTKVAQSGTGRRGGWDRGSSLPKWRSLYRWRGGRKQLQRCLWFTRVFVWPSRKLYCQHHPSLSVCQGKVSALRSLQPEDEGWDKRRLKSIFTSTHLLPTMRFEWNCVKCRLQSRSSCLAFWGL